MMCIYYVQFLIISICAHIFTLLTYIFYYTDLFNSIYLQDFENAYDFIIVGSGTAGSLIAHRLATETNYTFIVLEAGGRGHSFLEIPVLGPFLQTSLYDWHFETVPQDNACLAMKDRKCKLPQGRIVGGSSKLNNMIYVRGNISHYVDWFNGIHSEHYIKQQFKFIEKEILYLDTLQYQSSFSDNLLNAAKELGYNDLDLEFKIGFSKSIVNQKNGKRWTTSDNLDIRNYLLSNAMVEKVVLDGNTAKEVYFTFGNKKRKILAKNGVILSAGTYNSPKILQLSGIGPKDLLQSLEIPVVKNLPVGRNLQDHVTTGLDLVLFDKSVSVSAMDMINPYNTLQYFFNGKGSYTSPGCEALGFLSSENNSVVALQIMMLAAGVASDRGSFIKHSLGLKDEHWTNYFSKSLDKYLSSILPIVLHPKSRGSVFINSTDYEIPPLIDPNYLSNIEDVELLIKGIKKVIDFVQTDSMREIGAHLNMNKFPGCENYEIFSEEYLECYIRHLTLTSYHPVGTCAMGLPESENSVVDTSFKVLGMNNLFVVDASVLPTLPSGNINGAISMMASLFFETNIKNKFNEKVDNLYCHKYDFFFEILYEFCLSD